MARKFAKWKEVIRFCEEQKVLMLLYIHTYADMYTYTYTDINTQRRTRIQERLSNKLFSRLNLKENRKVYKKFVMRGLHAVAATPAILVGQNPFCELIKLIN